MGETVKGDHLQAVWSKGRASWDDKALMGYTKAHPELLEFRKQGEPSVSIRSTSGKNTGQRSDGKGDAETQELG